MKRDGSEREWLIVDGYNVIGAWQDLRALAAHDLADARDQLTEHLLDYCGHTGQTLVLVFDAHSMPHATHQHRATSHGDHRIVFTKRGQTADNYIERFVRKHVGEQMAVVSSDALVQVMIFMHAARVSTRELEQAIERQRASVTRRERAQSTQKQGLGQALDMGAFEALDALRYADDPPTQSPDEPDPPIEPTPSQPSRHSRPTRKKRRQR